MRRCALGNDASDVMVQCDVVELVLHSLLRYVVSVLVCTRFMFCLVCACVHVCMCDVCVCFDVCIVFVLGECSVFLLSERIV